MARDGGEEEIGVSKPSPAEKRYFDKLAAYLRDSWVPCPIYPNLRAVERSHPRGVAEWGTGTGIKAHHFFAVGLSKKAHLEYDADHDGFEKRHGVRHAELVKKQWEEMRVISGGWMMEGMGAKRAQWLSEILQKI